MKKFYGAEDAARFAADITNEWQTQEGEIWDSKTLIGVAGCADGENPLDEEDEDIYYVVDENGAVGYTENDGEDIAWWVTPTKISVAVSKPTFCPNCGEKVESDWGFCENCGQKLG